MPTPEANIRTYIDAAQTAIESIDYATARKKLVQAEMELMKIPESEDYNGLRVQNRNTISRLYEHLSEIKTEAEASGRTVRLSARIV